MNLFWSLHLAQALSATTAKSSTIVVRKGQSPAGRLLNRLRWDALSFLSSTKMTTAELPVESKVGTIIDFGTIWKIAISRYEEITMVKIQSLAEAKDVDEILNDIHNREAKFKGYRHDGSKLDKFRTLVRKSLNPIEKVGNMVASASSTVRK